VELIFEMWLKWSNRNAAETDYSYALNRDFVEESFDPNVVRVINESEMSGVISPLTAFNLRKRFEIYEDGTTFEAEQDLIETSSPITERLEPAPTRVDNQEDEAA
jgi:hypothetical protein